MRTSNSITKNKVIKKKTIGPKMKTPKILKCPVYKCFKVVNDDEQLMRHYEEVHKDLKELGLELTTQGG